VHGKGPRAYVSRCLAFVVCNAIFWPVIFGFYLYFITAAGGLLDLKGWATLTAELWGGNGKGDNLKRHGGGGGGQARSAAGTASAVRAFLVASNLVLLALFFTLRVFPFSFWCCRGSPARGSLLLRLLSLRLPPLGPGEGHCGVLESRCALSQP